MMVQAIWQEFLKIAHEKVGSSAVETWFKAIEPVRFDGLCSVIYLSAPNTFVQQWITTHYNTLLTTQLGRLCGQTAVTVSFVPLITQQSSDTSLLHVPNQLLDTVIPAYKLPVSLAKPSTSLSTTYRFETFVVDPSNSLAYAAALAVAQNPGNVYNPFFMYGRSGLGKTHLLHAIGNHIKETDKQVRIVYQSADRFVQEFIQAIRHNRVMQFETKYKNIDVLLVDDIHFISNKEQTQEAFFSIFNVLHQAHKQVVVTSDCLPHDIAGLADRMRSRLEGGLVADINMPSLETKVAIVQQKALARTVELSDEVAYCIAARAINNIRELEGLLIKVLAYASLTHHEITAAFVEKVIGPIPEKQEIGIHEMGFVAHVVSKHFNIPLTTLRAAGRNKDIAFARHILFYCLKTYTKNSLKEIGVFLGGRDHSTVIHAFNKIEKERICDASLHGLLHTLEDKINKPGFAAPYSLQ
jgi:chromosomal replication initiator protein